VFVEAGGFVVDDVVSFTVERVGDEHQPRSAGPGHDLTGLVGHTDRDVFWGGQHVAASRVGQLLGEPASVASGVAGHQCQRLKAVSGVAGEHARQNPRELISTE
jgi:hypothetical protein